MVMVGVPLYGYWIRIFKLHQAKTSDFPVLKGVKLETSHNLLQAEDSERITDQ